MMQALVRERVDFVVVGGVAASLQGSARVTNDLDICYDTADENLKRLAALLKTLNATLRGADADLPFVIDTRTFRDCPLLTLMTDEGFLDVMDHVSGVGAYAEARRAAEWVEWDGLGFYSLSLAGIIDAKKATGRRKDREHLIELEAIAAIKQRK
jgi:hypothetical protein